MSLLILSYKKTLVSLFCCCSVAKLCLTLQPHGLQHARLFALHTLPECSNFCPLNGDAIWLCHPLSHPSFAFIFFHHQRRISMSQLFASGGQSIGASSSASVLAMNIQCWFPFRIDWFYLLIAQGTLKSLLQHHNSKSSIFLVLSLLHDPTLTSICYLITWSFVGKVMSLLFNMLSRLVIAFLPRSKHF